MLDSLWPYRFTSRAPLPFQERRQLLDLRGRYAQLSALVIFILVSVYVRYLRLQARAGKGKSSRANNGLRSASWLSAPPVAGWAESRKQYLIVVMWLGWMLWLSAWKTGDDYLHLTKSLAHTIFASIPFQVLLSPKLSSRNPILRLSGVSQATLTPYHRLFGRIVIFPLLTLHAVLYLNFFTLSRLLKWRVRNSDVQLGITGILLVFVLWVTSSSIMAVGGLRRRVSRRTFYVLHVSLVGALLAVAYYHVVYAQKYVLQALAIYAIDVVSYMVEKARG